MSVKIRLQRKGRRKKPYYHIVVADARAPRDGRYIERLGSYNPGTVPATITLNVDSSVEWLAKGAQPTDTVRSILSFKGVMYRHHLNKGIAKGALTEEQANKKYDVWIAEKETLIQGQKDKEATKKETALKELFKLETKKKEERAAKILEKNTPAAEETSEATEEGTEASTEGEVVTETETPKDEAPTEEVVAEVVEEEAPVKEVVEEKVAEEESPKGEAPEVVAETEAPSDNEKNEDSDTKEA